MTVFDMNNAIENSLGTKMDVYAIYLRKSRADVEAEKEGEGETLARHKKILTDFAARKGLYVGEIYQEIVSGETIEARPEVQRLIADCYAGKYRGIIIIEVTRLSRGNQGDAQKILDCLKYSNRNNGVLVLTPTKTYDVAHSQEDEEFMEFELFMSRREYKMIHKRMDRGRKQAVIEGNYMGSYRPYGYDILKTRTGRTLVPNKEEAPIVQLMYEWALRENLTTHMIAKRLTSMGVPTYTGSEEWARDTVRTILTNPTYIGKVRWNDRMQIKTMVDGELVTSRPRSNHTDHYMLYDGKHKKHALIDEETFYAVSTKFHSDKTKHNLKLTNPLAGLLVCKHCNTVLRYQSFKSKPGVSPRYLHRPSVKCKVKSVIASDVMDAVIHCVKLYLADFEVKVNNLPDVDENSINVQIDTMNKELRNIEKKLSKLFYSWEEELITNNEFVQRKAVHNERIESIKRQIKELENSIPEKEEYEERVIMFSEVLEVLLDDNLDADIKNNYLKRIFDKIEFSRENNGEFILDIDLHS